jgi:hypothetical protein
VAHLSARRFAGVCPGTGPGGACPPWRIRPRNGSRGSVPCGDRPRCSRGPVPRGAPVCAAVCGGQSGDWPRRGLSPVAHLPTNGSRGVSPLRGQTPLLAGGLSGDWPRRGLSRVAHLSARRFAGVSPGTGPGGACPPWRTRPRMARGGQSPAGTDPVARGGLSGDWPRRGLSPVAHPPARRFAGVSPGTGPGGACPPWRIRPRKGSRGSVPCGDRPRCPVPRGASAHAKARGGQSPVGTDPVVLSPVAHPPTQRLAGVSPLWGQTPLSCPPWRTRRRKGSRGSVPCGDRPRPDTRGTRTTSLPVSATRTGGCRRPGRTRARGGCRA